MKKKQTSADFTEVFADLEKWNEFVNEYKIVERLIWTKGDNARERNGAHCMQLAMVADYLNVRYSLGFDSLLMYREIMAHDAPETYAEGGDTPAFPDPTGTYKISKACTRETKEKRERVAIEQIEREWGERYPLFVETLHGYNAQDNDRRRFIYALDKLISSLNCAQDKGRTNRRLKVTRRAEDAYKRPRIAAHPFVLGIYDVLCAKLLRNPHLHHQEDEIPASVSIAAE